MNELDQLRTEVAELRALVTMLTSGHAEIVCRRLAVVDDLGERITLTADTFGEALVTVSADPLGDSTSVMLHAGPDCGTTELGVLLCADGDIRARLHAIHMTPENRGHAAPPEPGWWPTLELDRQPEPEPGAVRSDLTLDHRGLEVRQREVDQ